ncbi:MAG: sulfotransferase [Pirellulaceae bacterium]|nr:sulfotransferase [Pirellulaceae bacterium]
MAWRETFLRCFGPGMLGGITFGDWLRLLRENRFAIAPTSWLRALSITSQSTQNSLFRWLEQKRFGASFDDVEVPPPLFVLGHWRSGTTHLHNLLAVDRRFGFPNNYQVFFPHTFLTMESLHSPFVEWFLPRQRPMDQIQWTMQSPQEDEFALCTTTFKSPYMGWSFPARREYYDRYLTLRGVSDAEVEQWKAGLIAFLKRLTWKLRRPLVLKSPPHTCRIKRLLEIFPQARFVHIHRDPYAVFLSTRHMLTVNFRMHCLQRPRMSDLDAWILEQYRRMYEAFFGERDLIPAGQFHEVRFEYLERDPVGEVQQVYDSLGLPALADVRADVDTYARSIQGFQKNNFPALPADLRQRIADQWQFCFKHWSYPVEG